MQNFCDNYESKYSIHNITSIGKKYNINIGSWYGPNLMASIFRFDIVKCFWDSIYLPNHWIFNRQLIDINPFDDGKLKLVISDDGVIYADQIFKPFQTESLVILLCLRLGRSSFNKKYQPILRYLCESKHFIGIIGGKPSSSYFFIGCQGIYLKFNSWWYCLIAI